jgi:outer membrane receptor for ferrienterochelin and colicin
VAQRNLAKIAAGAVLGLIVLSSRGAVADERTEARTHFKKGMAAIAEGHYDVGIEELKSAYEILPHPNILYNIARAYVDTGDLDDAVSYYKRYLEGDPKDRDEVAAMVSNLQERLRKQQAMLLESQQTQVGAPSGPGAPPAPGSSTGPGTPTGPGALAPGGPGPGPLPGAAPGTTPEGPVPTPAIAPREGAEGAEAGGSLKTEEVFEETVVTASRAAQSPLDAPNSTSIITQQDIRLSGITKIPELLRRLAGVDIMETTGSQTEVSMRGFNQRLSNKVLVLVDGRSVYTDLLGATIWAGIPVAVEDVERIEVVRGPGSALYGADAFNGVINIITKPPGEGTNGVNLGYGNQNSAHGTVWANGRSNDLAYRLSAGYDYEPRWSREVPRDATGLHTFVSDQDMSGREVRMEGEVTRHFGKDVIAGVFASYGDGQTEILGEGSVNDDVILAEETQLAAYVKAKHFEVRSFWTHTAASSGINSNPIGQSLLPNLSTTNVVDAEAQYIANVETGRDINHDLHVGVAYRLKQVDWTYLVQNELENHGGLFVHDEVKLGRRFAIVGDYRADYVPFLSRIVQSPRGSLLIHPSPKSTVRGIVATAFRTPNFLESYIGLPVQLPAAGVSLATPRNPQKIQPEQIFTTELGYLNSESDFFTLDTAVFRNHANNLIEVRPNVPITVADVNAGTFSTGVNDATGTYPLFAGGFDNQCQSYNVYGGELGVRTFPIEGLDVYANYTLMKVVEDTSGCSAEQLALLAPDARTSASKINGGVQLRTKTGLDAELDIHFVSPQTWAEQVSDVQRQQIVYQSFYLPSYELLNARLGYRFLRNQAEVSGVAFNLLNDKHREHPFGQLIGRQLMGFISYRF